MSRPMCEIIDIQTGESIIREMNDEEYSQYLADQAAWEAQEAERLAKQAEVDAAKAAVHEKLAALGLDMETVKLIAKLG
jgi:hypothetical protein